MITNRFGLITAKKSKIRNKSIRDSFLKNKFKKVATPKKSGDSFITSGDFLATIEKKATPVKSLNQ